MDLPSVMRLTLTGQDNSSYVGTLYLRNASVRGPVNSGDYSPASASGSVAQLNSPGIKPPPPPHPVFSRGSSGRSSSSDPNGATYYVVVVPQSYARCRTPVCTSYHSATCDVLRRRCRACLRLFHRSANRFAHQAKERQGAGRPSDQQVPTRVSGPPLTTYCYYNHRHRRHHHLVCLLTNLTKVTRD